MPDPSRNRTSDFDFSLEEIRLWGGERQFIEALEQYANKGDVQNARFANGVGEADITHAGHMLHTRFRTVPGNTRRHARGKHTDHGLSRRYLCILCRCVVQASV